MTGKEYADLVASYILQNFGSRGLVVYREVQMGKTIIGKNRHVDIFVVHPGTSTALSIECKYQDKLGTVDEKIPYAIDDMQAMGVPVCLVYAGSGFSQGILHMLAACPIAAQCAPSATLERTRETRELDIAIAMAFRFWDLIVSHKQPFELAAVPETLSAEPAVAPEREAPSSGPAVQERTPAVPPPAASFTLELPGFASLRRGHD
jgi:hypothetical protein